MSRLTQAPVQAALEEGHVEFAVFVDLDFASGRLRAFNGVGQQIFRGEVYDGVGTLGGISAISERVDEKDFNALRLTLSGVDASIVAKVPDRDEYYNRSAAVYFVPFDLKTYKPIEPAEPALFEGFMDQMPMKRSESGAAIEVVIRHHSTEWGNSIGLMFTHEHQRQIDASDDFFDQVHTVRSKTVVWGGSSVESGSALPGTRDNRNAVLP